MTESIIDEHIQSLKELWLTDTDLSFLHEVEPSLLARITAEVKAHAERTNENQRRIYESMARATRFIPNFVLGKLSGNMSPYVLARVTEYLEPKNAAALSKSYEPPVLAEIALHLPAELAASIASHTDVDTLTVITNLLAKKGMWRRLGEISDGLDERLLEKLVGKIGDPVRIAAVAAHMTAFDKLRAIASKIDGKLLRAVVALLNEQGHAVAAQALAR
jgi:hypothetical protein